MDRPKRPCAQPGCCGLVEFGYCPAHAPRTAEYRKRYDHQRGSSTKRGYDGDWKRFRKAFLADNPHCADCRERKRETPSTCVHHELKIRTHPHLRLVRSNCRALCKPCHDRRTARGE
jgi:5-methylcytosine-specific restriction protein A